jgi:hypothetical protein
MKQQAMIRQIENDAETKRDLEGLANAIENFRGAVRHISANCERQAAPVALQMKQARGRRRSAQRRVMLEWAVAAGLCLAMLLPVAGHYRYEAAQAREQQQLLEQRTADAALLDQVASEIEEPVPDAMSPLADLDAQYAGDSGSIQQGEKNNGRN